MEVHDKARNFATGPPEEKAPIFVMEGRLGLPRDSEKEETFWDWLVSNFYTVQPIVWSL